MSLLEQHKDQIEALCVKHCVRRLYAFGSVLTDRFSSLSDIDLVVDFSPQDPRSYTDNYFGLKFALEKLFGRSVDLLEEKAIRNPFFKQSVEGNRSLLYAA